MFERLGIFILKLLGKEKEQTYHHLFMSIPLSYEDDTNNEDEGMVGKILNVARAHHKENQATIQKNHKENQKEIQDAKAEIVDALEEKVEEIQEMISESQNKQQQESEDEDDSEEE